MTFNKCVLKGDSHGMNTGSSSSFYLFFSFSKKEKGICWKKEYQISFSLWVLIRARSLHTGFY